jgi:hypothetical protein
VTARLRTLFAVLLGDLAAHDLAVERQGLQYDVEALAVLVREGKADIEPVVVLAIPFVSTAAVKPAGGAE